MGVRVWGVLLLTVSLVQAAPTCLDPATEPAHRAAGAYHAVLLGAPPALVRALRDPKRSLFARDVSEDVRRLDQLGKAGPDDVLLLYVGWLSDPTVWPALPLDRLPTGHRLLVLGLPGNGEAPGAESAAAKLEATLPAGQATLLLRLGGPGSGRWLTQGLAGEGDLNDDGQITVEELFLFALWNTRREADMRLPAAVMHLARDAGLVLARNPAAKTPRACDEPKTPPQWLVVPLAPGEAPPPPARRGRRGSRVSRDRPDRSARAGASAVHSSTCRGPPSSSSGRAPTASWRSSRRSTSASPPWSNRPARRPGRCTPGRLESPARPAPMGRLVRLICVTASIPRSIRRSSTRRCSACRSGSR